MSVATKNPFAILEDDSSRPSTPAPAAKKTDAPAATTAPASRGAPKSRGPAARGGRYYQRGGKAPREGQEAGAEEAPADGEKKKFEGEGRGRGRGRGRGGRGGDRGGRGRPFDRHSATGKTDSDKKVHQSWGGDDGTTELKAEEAAGADAQAEVANNDWAGTPTAEADPWATPAGAETEAAPVAAEGDTAGEGRRGREGREGREREPEEEDNTLTLDQYLAQQREREAAAIPKLEGVRAANEGDDSIFKDAVQHQKKTDEDDAYFVGKTKSAHKTRSKKEEKVFIEIDARFERPSRGGRGRGGDRGGRGTGERGRGARGGRGARPPRTNGATPAVKFDDETAFPSLS